MAPDLPGNGSRIDRLLDACTDFVTTLVQTLTDATRSLEGRLTAGALVPLAMRAVARSIGLDADAGFFTAMADLSYIMIGSAAVHVVAKTVRKVRRSLRIKRERDPRPGEVRRGSPKAPALVRPGADAGSVPPTGH